MMHYPEAMDFPRCDNVGIDCYMRMPTDPPLVDLKAEMLPEICEEEGATLEPYFPLIVSFHMRCVDIYAGITVIPCMSASFKMLQASLERVTCYTILIR